MREPRPTAAVHRAPSLRRRLGVLLLGLAFFPAAALAVQVREIPSPRPAGWSVDLTGRVPKATLAEIDRLGNEVQASGAELAVVVIRTTAGVPSHTFATELFNTWHIGQVGKDNGVLVFVALVDHRIELVLGRGLSSPAGREASAEIIRNEMVARLRQDDPGGAVLAGAKAAARRLLDVPAASETAAPSEATAPSAPLAALPSSGSPSAPHDTIQFPEPPPPAAAPLPGPPEAKPDSGTPPAILLGLLFLCVVGGVSIWLSTRPRRCPRCRAPEERLSPEAAVAAFPLTPIEETEARLGSVTVEAYRCSSCGELEKVRRPHAFSAYQSCPQCTAVALSKRTWTVRPATYDWEGLVETEWRCQHCTYQSSSTATTPRLIHSSSGSYSSSSDSQSSSSSSSGSDSGFGGGSSSGDGASGSW